MSKKSKITLFIENPIITDSIISLGKGQSHYLANVMRRKNGDQILLFNGKDGQWQAEITQVSKKNTQVKVTKQTKQQLDEPDVWLCFAPVKNAPIYNIAQKATELGVAKLQPVITQNTITSKVNTDRIKANTIEAAEQCQRLTVPDVANPLQLEDMLDKWPNDRTLILCDESGNGTTFIKAFNDPKKGKYAILIGPEGGFTQTEFELMRKCNYVKSVSMGPRILRADTAAIAALTCYMSILGDWDEQPHFEG